MIHLSIPGPCTLRHEWASMPAAQRYHLEGGLDREVLADEVAELHYDHDEARYLLVEIRKRDNLPRPTMHIVRQESPDRPPPIAPGTTKRIMKATGRPIVFKHDSNATPPANRFHLPDGHAFVLMPGECVGFLMEKSADGWRFTPVSIQRILKKRARRRRRQRINRRGWA